MAGFWGINTRGITKKLTFFGRKPGLEGIIKIWKWGEKCSFHKIRGKFKVEGSLCSSLLVTSQMLKYIQIPRSNENLQILIPRLGGGSPILYF